MNYKYSKLIQGLELSISILHDKIERAKKDKDWAVVAEHKAEKEELESEVSRLLLAQAVSGDEMTLVRW